jgi:tetratricopeptide (TPR) repeat protein
MSAGAEALKHLQRGAALSAQGRVGEAAEAYARAAAACPDLPEAHYNLGVARQRQGRVAEAAQCWRRALELRPEFTAARNNLGAALLAQGDAAGAAQEHRAALEREPRSLPALVGLGNALRRLDQFAEAAGTYRRAIAADPASAIAHGNLGLALQDMGELADAEAALRRAVALRPDYAEMRKSLGMLLLLTGQFAEGWRELEWRWKTPWHRRHPSTQPVWRGEPAQGKTILLHSDQGHGDTIQFLRYAPLVAGRGARVALEVQPALKRLCASLAGVAEVVTPDAPAPAHDLVCPLLDLPAIFATRLETIPAAVPYLRADPAAAERWRRRLADRPGLKVGLVWSGNPAFVDDHRRSLDPALLAPLLKVEGVSLHSLQAGPAAEGLRRVPGAERVMMLGGEFADFADTAACIAALDLVISSCTSVPHLAGAMGKKVWLTLAFAADWRWLKDRVDSPWYPSARLFRQERPGGWPGVVERVARALEAEAKRR